MAKRAISEWEGRYSHISFWWSVFFGAGLLKPAPGTWGSLAALLVGYGLIEAGVGLAGLLALTAVITLVSIWAINDIEAKSSIHDAGEIVIDEVAGQWLALIPLYFYVPSPSAYVAAFLLFRLFDIWKPWPIGPLDRKVSGGLGVMVDDIVAGLFAAVALLLLLRFDLLPA